MHCYYCQGGVKRLSGEQESRKVSPRQTLKRRSVPWKSLGAGVWFFYWLCVVDFFLIYIADVAASWLPTQQARDPPGGITNLTFKRKPTQQSFCRELQSCVYMVT